MACPPKYRHMTSFYEYYTGAKRAPILTVFIGGNHEGSNYLWELCYGGWVADNIYYLGRAGVISVGGLRLAGLSGIYSAGHYQLGHFERPPYTEDTKRSAYHVRELDVFRLALVTQPVDAVLSHDWPAGIAHHGDRDRLFQQKPFLRSEVRCACASLRMRGAAAADRTASNKSRGSNSASVPGVPPPGDGRLPWKPARRTAAAVVATPLLVLGAHARQVCRGGYARDHRPWR